MSTPETRPLAPLPDYIASATPNPFSSRAPWFKNTAPTYAGIFLWFVYWQDAANASTPGGALAAGIGPALLGLLIAVLICHFGFYLVPGLLGQKTGLPLYIVGTSTFGATGGFLMPGFLMGLLQFGWLGVNTYFSSLGVAQVVPIPPEAIMIVWGIGAAALGLLGIQYVARVSTYLPLIPLVILVVMLAKTIGGVGSFEPQRLIDAQAGATATAGTGATEATQDEASALAETADESRFDTGEDTAGGATAAEVQAAPAPMGAMAVIAFLLTYVVGFFATAGAAGVDFGMNNRDRNDVQMGGLIGVALVGFLAAAATVLIVAGVHGSQDLSARAFEATGANPNANVLRSTDLIPVVLGSNAGKWLLFLLALSAFPSACFSSFIAANSFKTTLPKVNPFVSVGIGAAVSIGLALSGYAGNAVGVFEIIGASFGPICGAMLVDYVVHGYRWSGPRSGFNPAGWIAWALGFVVGITPRLHALEPSIPAVPAATVAAFVVGALVYFVCAKAGLMSPVLPMPQRIDAAGDAKVAG